MFNIFLRIIWIRGLFPIVKLTHFRISFSNKGSFSLIFLKEDKTSNCYTFHNLLDNLHDLPAETVAQAIGGKPENLNCTSGFDMIFNSNTRFSCIENFRSSLNEIEMKNPGYKDMIKQSPIILLNPTKPIHNENQFRYDI